jgi:hypothetical protein
MVNEGLSKGVLGSQLQDVIRMVISRGVQELKKISQKGFSEVGSAIAPHPCLLVIRRYKAMSPLEQIQDDLHHKVVAFGINNLPRFVKYLPDTDCYLPLDEEIRVNVYNALRSHGTDARVQTFLGYEGCTFTEEEWDTACKDYNDHIKGHHTAAESETIKENLKLMTESVFALIHFIQAAQDRKASTRSGSSNKRDSTLYGHDPMSTTGTGSIDTQ